LLTFLFSFGVSIYLVTLLIGIITKNGLDEQIVEIITLSTSSVLFMLVAVLLMVSFVRNFLWFRQIKVLMVVDRRKMRDGGSVVM
jgi:hypothetical protein